ncbi:MAG TPA: NADH pyrophosphatase zinc ribbon domain-containing protein, partial [Rubrobacteraceae bacterium]|nr:NADH pyrophosphatase zinc ribbon domain-containing protein [Rubrobacteraceae bacterium]
MTDTDQTLWFAFSGDWMLVCEGEADSVPRATSLRELGMSAGFRRDVGVLDGHRCYAVDLGPDAEVPEGMVLRDLRSLWDADEAFFAMAGRAKQIIEWNRTHQFCGRDGTDTVPGPTEFSKECPRCGLLFYPRLSPAVIVLVRRGDNILLARSPGFPKGMYSVLAGFVEPGEAIEATISR